MKKFYVAAAAFIAMGLNSNAQVLLNQDFQGTIDIQFLYPSGSSTDVSWYSVDQDGNPDGSPSSRPGDWFFTYAFAQADSIHAGTDTNIVMASNSWHSTVAQADNWLVTESVVLPAGTGTLKFKTASFQTPYYLDGYEALISTTDNDLGSFTQIYRAAEYTAGDLTEGQAGDYSSYTFAPSGEWTQGINAGAIVMSEVEDNDGDLARYTGLLVEKTIDLSAYAGQTVFIAFHHNSTDDNLLSIDDIRIDWTVGVNETESLLSKVTAYPNPTTDYVTFEYTMSAASPVIMTVTDVYGRVINTESLGIVGAGISKKGLDVSGYAAGTYNVQLRTDRGVKSMSFVKN